jgi:hypothetical protein
VADAEIQFLLWSVTMRRSTLVLLALGVGVLIGWILHGIQSRTRRRREEDARIATDLAPVSESERMEFESRNSDR